MKTLYVIGYNVYWILLKNEAFEPVIQRRKFCLQIYLWL